MRQNFKNKIIIQTHKKLGQKPILSYSYWEFCISPFLINLTVYKKNNETMFRKTCIGQQ